MKVTSAEYPEVEYTYELEPGALGALWRVFFVGPTGVELDGAIYRRVATVERIAIHLFLETDQPRQLYLRNAPRLSARGHTLYARELAAFLVRNVPAVWNSGSDNHPSRQPRQTAERIRR